MKKFSGVSSMTPINPMGDGGQRDKPDTAGGMMLQMSSQKVPVAAGSSAKASMMDGPYGGKVKA